MGRPNILYIHSHDTGRYIQPYGHAIATPNLQRLAEQGVLFRQAFCAGPTCSPSRAALVTGQSPHSCGMIGLAHRGFSLIDHGRHVCHTLRRAGYFTGLIGVQHEARGPNVEKLGYEKVFKTNGARAGVMAPLAVEFLTSAPPQPFFLSVGCGDTHRDFSESDPIDAPLYSLPPAPIPDTPVTRRDMAAFKKRARAIDEAWGTVFAALEATGLADHTLVICTTDHGIAFPGMKCNLTDHGIGVMLVLRGPGGFLGGQVVDALVSQIDLFPTICQVAGIDRPAWLEGESVVPLVTGQAERIHEEIFSEVTYHAAYEPMRCVRTTRYKYVRRFDDRGRPVLANCDDSPSKDLWRAHGWRDRPVARDELYDLIFDPNEAHNIAADGAALPVLTDLRGRLEAWMCRTDDPLLKGPVPAPPGAVISDPDDLSPRDVNVRLGKK